MADQTPHRCDEGCVCPVDGKPLLYWPVGGHHACQDPDCSNAHGVVEPDVVSALTARIRAIQRSAPATPAEAATALDDALQPGGAGVIVCYARCWACQFDEHHNPPKPHPWADADDLEHAKNTGQQPPIGNCACHCAKETTPG